MRLVPPSPLSPLLLAVSLLLDVAAFGSPTPNETCTLPQSGTLTCSAGAASCSYEDAGTPLLFTGCLDLGSDDWIVIDGGVGTPISVTCAGDIVTSDGSCTNCGIRVSAEDTFSCSVDTHAREIRLGQHGLVCEEGSTCSLKGRVLGGFGSAAITRESSLPTGAFPRIPKLVPCPLEDVSGFAHPSCDGPTRPDRVRFEWSEAEYGPFSGSDPPDTHVDSYLAEVTPGEDYLCFFNVYGENPSYVPAELNHCYDVVAKSATTGTTDPLWIEIDLMQGRTGGAADSEVQPLSRRRISQAQILADAIAGQREIQIESGALPAIPPEMGNSDYAEAWLDGAWLLMGDGATTAPCGAANPCDTETIPYRLQDVASTAVPATLELLDIRGLRHAYPAGTTAFIALGMGFEQGDRFDVVKPLLITSGVSDMSCQGYTCPAEGHFEGGADIELQYAKLSGLGRVTVGGPNNNATGACPTLWDHVWIADTVATGTGFGHAPGFGGNKDAYLDIRASKDGCATWGHTSITGTDENDLVSFENTGHAVHVETACTRSIPATCQHESSITFSDLAIRYHQDDCIDLENSGPPGAPGEVTVLNGFRCEYLGYGADTASFFDGGGHWDPLDGDYVGRLHLNLDNGLCIACAGNDGASGPMTTGGGDAAFWGGTHSGLFILGGVGFLGVHLNTLDSTMVGVHNVASAGAWFGGATNFRIRDMTEASGAENTGSLPPNRSITNGYVSDTAWRLICRNGCRYENNAIENPSRGTVSMSTGSSNWSVRRNSYIFTGFGVAAVDQAGPYANSRLLNLACGANCTIEHVEECSDPGENPYGTNMHFGESLVVGYNPQTSAGQVFSNANCWDAPLLSLHGGSCTSDAGSVDGGVNGYSATPAPVADQLQNGLGVHPQIDPGFEPGSYETADGGFADLKACGARNGDESPGVHKLTIPHLLNKVEPECLGGSCIPADPDRDGDGTANELDAFPDDPLESIDTDGDGAGDNADLDDDDDGLSDAEEMIIGTDPLHSDTDADGWNDAIEIEWGQDPTSPQTAGIPPYVPALSPLALALLIASSLALGLRVVSRRRLRLG